MAATIYALVDPRNKKIRYVGVTTKTVEFRLKQHLNAAKRGYSSQPYCHSWLRQLLKEDLFPKVKILEVVSPSKAVAAERRWIKKYEKTRWLTNLTSGGEGHFGSKLSPEVRKRMSQARLASESAIAASKTNVQRAHEANRGRKHSEEHRAKIGAAQLGKKRSYQTRQNISAALIGKIRSQQHGKNISFALTGRALSFEHRANIGKALAGKTHSSETREKMRQSRIAYLQAQKGIE